MVDCPIFCKKQKPNPVTLIGSVTCPLPIVNIEQEQHYSDVPEASGFKLFTIDGSVAPSDSDNAIPIRILRDTRASKSILLQGVLPLSRASFLGGDALILGFEMSCLRAPLHMVYLKCGLVTGLVQVGLVPIF